jgi:hypothetical protein
MPGLGASENAEAAARKDTARALRITIILSITARAAETNTTAVSFAPVASRGLQVVEVPSS